MCHTGSHFGESFPSESHPSPILFNTPAAAVTSQGAPGWSMYIGQTPVANLKGGMLACFDTIDYTPWGAPEWGPWLGKEPNTTSAWDSVYEDILGHRLLPSLSLTLCTRC